MTTTKTRYWPHVISDYYHERGVTSVPLLTEVFRPRATEAIRNHKQVGAGWRPLYPPRPLDYRHLRELRKDGVTAIAVTAAGRTADFEMTEIFQIW